MRGFTLIELVVVTVIIAIISGITMASWRATRESLALDREAHRVAQSIRSAMNYALQARQEDSCAPASDGISGFGTYFDIDTPDEYIFFANCNGRDNEGYRTGPDRDQPLEIFLLEDSFQIQSVQGEPESGTWGSGGQPTNHWSVAFFPPEPKIELCRRSGPATTSSDSCDGGAFRLRKAWIVLALTSDPGKTRTITVTNKGVIEIQ